MEDFASSHFVITSIKIQIDALKKNLVVGKMFEKLCSKILFGAKVLQSFFHFSLSDNQTKRVQMT